MPGFKVNSCQERNAESLPRLPWPSAERCLNALAGVTEVPALDSVPLEFALLTACGLPLLARGV